MNTSAAELPVDIRIMQRLTAWMWLLIGSLVLAAAVQWVMRLPYFALQTIVIEGDTGHNNALTIRANVATRLRGNLFSTDLQTTQTVFESLPWVRRAVVRREFPNRLRVRLEEHEAVAIWGREGEFQLLNKQAEVFETNPGDIDTDDLPRFIGPATQAGVLLQNWQRMRQLLTRYDLDIHSVELSERGNWQLSLDSGAVLDIGRGDTDTLMQRLGTFIATVTQATATLGRDMHKDIEHADLRHSNGYALKLKGIGTIGPQPLSRKTH